GHRKGDGTDPLDGQRQLHHPLAQAIDTGHDGHSEITEAAVALVEIERVMARVVSEPAALEDRQTLLIDAERRRPISDDRAPRDGLEHRARPDDVVAELAQGELHRHDVAVAVTGDLVAARGDLADERRLALGDPAEDEEGRANLVLGEEPEHAARGVCY